MKTGTDDFLPFSRPAVGEEEIQEVIDCLRSGWVTTGPRTQRFEALLKAYLQTDHALALTSATAGLHLALLSLALKPGDEVIVPAFTFIASFNTIVQAGGKPVPVDIDPHSYNIDPSKIKAAITPRTRAIMPVHFAGLSCDLDAIYLLARQYGLRVIEDAAQAIGTRYREKLIGSFGDVQVFSFHPNKNMTTIEGGCVSTRDEKLAEFIKAMRFHGIDREFSRFNKESSVHYDVIGPGFKYNMMDIQAALGIHQLPKLEKFNARRQQLAQTYHACLSDLKALTLPVEPAKAPGHSWHLYTPLLDPEKNPSRLNLTRDNFIEILKNKYHIGLGFHYDPPALYQYYQKTYGYKKGDFPQTDHVSERIVSLPLFPTMTDQDQKKVMDALYDLLH